MYQRRAMGTLTEYPWQALIITPKENKAKLYLLISFCNPFHFII